MLLRVVVTGASTGMGKAVCMKFIQEGHEVHGIDILGTDIVSENYVHHVADVTEVCNLPEIPDVNILINNAGAQDSGRDIDVNLKGVINCTRKYGLQPAIRSIVNQCCASVHTGCQFDEYVASKGGVYAYTKWTAKEIAKYGGTCNSLSFGGVYSDINSRVMDDERLWGKIMEQTPLKKWCTCKEAAQWIYMFSAINTSCSGQDLVIDNLESLNGSFIW